MIEHVRRGLRRSFRVAIRSGPAWFARAAGRLPFSRFRRLIKPLFGGSVETKWRGAWLSVDPAELEGYFRYFFTDGRDYEFDFLNEACRDASVYVDVGANQGRYALALASSHPELHVLAFEPDSRLVAWMQRNLTLNPGARDRVRIIAAAVGAASGSARFRPAVSMNSGVGAIVARGDAGTIQVPMVALADYLATAAPGTVVLKIDVEGAEVDVLRGLRQGTPALRAVLIELHPSNFAGDDQREYQRSVMTVLRELPFAYRFMLNESEWVDALSSDAPWPARLHAFGTRDAAR